MGAIHFDKPSSGEVDVNKKHALHIKYTGEEGHAIWSETTDQKGGAGVVGVSTNWIGVHGQSKTSFGVFGQSGDKMDLKTNAAGVAGVSANSWGVYGDTSQIGGYGVYGHSKFFDGIKGESDSTAGVAGIGYGPDSMGIYGQGGKWAGWFQGDVSVTGDIILQNADCAEDFDIVEDNVESGTVMVLTENSSLKSSHQEYDKKVAGVISGAGGYKPAFVLNRITQSLNENQSDKNLNNKKRLPIALMGKVYCKVDARQAAIEIGDLLTTSSTKGYAMKVEDPMKAFGAVIGKALGSIKEGLGMIPVLVTLR
jgi:hypothetical protein